MNKVNKIIFIGLTISGIFSIWGFIGFLIQKVNFFIGPEAIGMYFGLWFGLLAIASFIYGSIMYLIGRLDNYWQSLYPINFGLTLLGVALWQYNINMPVLWVLAVIILALTISLILYKADATKSRWLLVVLIGATLITENVTEVRFWDTIMIGIIFIYLAVVARYYAKPSAKTT